MGNQGGSVICSQCGGLVLWMGPLTNLTHTQCQQCGAINSHVTETVTDEENEEAA